MNPATSQVDETHQQLFEVQNTRTRNVGTNRRRRGTGCVGRLPTRPFKALIGKSKPFVPHRYPWDWLFDGTIRNRPSTVHPHPTKSGPGRA